MYTAKMATHKSIYFLSDWGKNKQRAWSGTNWGLFQTLSKHMDVLGIDDGHTGLLLRKQTPDALAQLMEQALTHPTMAAEVRQRRETYLSNYTWDTVAERIERIIRV